MSETNYTKYIKVKAELDEARAEVRKLNKELNKTKTNLELLISVTKARSLF